MRISDWSSDVCSSDLLRARLTAEMIGALGAAFADDKPALGRATQTLVRLRAYETDIILAQIGLLEADEAAEARGQQSEAFQRTVTDLVAATRSEERRVGKECVRTCKSRWRAAP